MQVAIDYRKRIEDLQAPLQQRGIDALFGTRLKTVTHVSGAFCPWRSATVIPAKGAPQVITLMMDAARVADDSWLDNVVAYGPFPEQGLVDMAASYIRALGLHKGTIVIACNRPGVAGFRLERPLLITPSGNELLSGLPFAPWVIDEGCVC